MSSARHQFATAARPAQLTGGQLAAGSRSRSGRPAGRHRPGARRSSIPGWLVLGLPAAAELVIGGYKLSGPPLWRQEGEALEVARRPVSALMAVVARQDMAHGLYDLFLHFVIAVLGTSVAALRLPSLLAAAAAAALTAGLGRRLARQSAIPGPSVVGLLSGLMLAAFPATTFYAQDACAAAPAMLAAVTATYCLVRGAAGDGINWWVAYSASLVLLGLLALPALSLAAAHGVSLLFAWNRSRREATEFAVRRRLGGRVIAAELRALAADAPAGGALPASSGWMIAAGVAVLALVPFAWITVQQVSRAGWLPGISPAEVDRIADLYTGGIILLPVLAVLVTAVVAADAVRAVAGRTLAAVAAPWLGVPPALLVGASVIRPVLTPGDLLPCLPALAMLTACGLGWLVWSAGRAAARRQLPAPGLIGAAAGALIAVAAVAALAGPQLAVRRPARTEDDFPAVASVVALLARPGDAVVYLPWQSSVVGLTESGPFSRLRDVAEFGSPQASATLWGTSAPANVLAARMAGVMRLWTVRLVRGAVTDSLGPPAAWQRRETALIRAMQPVRQWMIGSVLLTLYWR
jgi:mannosyltransferase